MTDYPDHIAIARKLLDQQGEINDLTAQLAALESGTAFPPPLRPDGTHFYVSTYCVHLRHAECRLTCLCCGAPCQCDCGHPKPEPECPYSYHDEHDEGVDFPCVCEPHAIGGAHGCPEGCPTHNHGGEDVPEGAIGGRATDEELGEEDRCPVCGCVVGPDCEACERDCRSGEALRTYATQVSAIAPGGNAEDCPRCSGKNPPYPFICPGHPTEDATAPDCRWPACLSEADQQLLAEQVGASMLGEATALMPDPRPGCGCVDRGVGRAWRAAQ